MTRVSTHTLHGAVPSNYEGLKSLLGPSGVLKDAGSHERPLGRAAAELGLQSLIIISSSTPHPRRHRRHTPRRHRRHTRVVIDATHASSSRQRRPPQRASAIRYTFPLSDNTYSSPTPSSPNDNTWPSRGTFHRVRAVMRPFW